MFAIPYFQGVLPRIGKRLVPATSARVINNVDLDSRACDPYAKPLRYVEPTKVGTLEKIYRYIPQIGVDLDAAIQLHTNGNPVVITAPNHGLVTGDVITISGINLDFDNTPTVTDIDGDDIIAGNQSNVVITGTKFGATQGNGFIEFGRWPTYHDTAKVKQAVSSWTDTQITVTSADLSTWKTILPDTLYVWVTRDVP